jgi:hypothetical protein
MIGAPLPAYFRAGQERIVNTIQTRLDQQEFATALTQGREMTLEQAILFSSSF